MNQRHEHLLLHPQELSRYLLLLGIFSPLAHHMKSCNSIAARTIFLGNLFLQSIEVMLKNIFKEVVMVDSIKVDTPFPQTEGLFVKINLTNHFSPKILLTKH
jgi:hypothetical protein